jgi:hypothetical protein
VGDEIVVGGERKAAGLYKNIKKSIQVNHNKQPFRYKSCQHRWAIPPDFVAELPFF